MTNEVSRRGSIPRAMAWMIGLSAVLFWMPFLGGLIAGFVGGQKAGSPGRAVAAAILPGVIFGLVVFFLGGLFGWIPILGHLISMLAGMGGLVLSSLHVIPLLIGAVIGGMTAR
jgi:hypothetical protein